MVSRSQPTTPTTLSAGAHTITFRWSAARMASVPSRHMVNWMPWSSSTTPIPPHRRLEPGPSMSPGYYGTPTPSWSRDGATFIRHDPPSAGCHYDVPHGGPHHRRSPRSPVTRSTCSASKTVTINGRENGASGTVSVFMAPMPPDDLQHNDHRSGQPGQHPVPMPSVFSSARLPPFPSGVFRRCGRGERGNDLSTTDRSLKRAVMPRIRGMHDDGRKNPSHVYVPTRATTRFRWQFRIRPVHTQRRLSRTSTRSRSRRTSNLVDG